MSALTSILARRRARMLVDPAGARSAPARDRRAVDKAVRERFRAGDPDAVRIVYRAYGPLVFAVAFRVLGDRGLSEEATQQSFVQAWRAAASVEAGRELRPWLATIARRVAIDIHRREKLRAAGPLDAVAPDHPALIAPAGADAWLDVWEVRQAVSELPGEQQEIVRLQHFDGLGHDEIAARLGMPVGTVKSRSFRAHRRLALALGHLREGNPAAPAGRSDLQEANR